jgi:hypothetical protein
LTVGWYMSCSMNSTMTILAGPIALTSIKSSALVKPVLYNRSCD